MAFEHNVRVYWEDTDAGGIVFYANYLKFFERARTEWLRALGFGQHALLETAQGMFVVSETAVKYHHPARLDDLLTITAKINKKGRSSLEIKQLALLKSEQNNNIHLLCEGTIRIGWVNAQSLRPGRIPLQVLEKLT